MRQKTQEMLKLAETATQESIELEKEADELEMKINYLKKVSVLYMYVVIYTVNLLKQNSSIFSSP